MHPGLIKLRLAVPSDRPALADLHTYAFRINARGIYDPAVIDAAAERCVALDPALIADGRYWLIEAGGAPVASAGWSAEPPAWTQSANVSSEPGDAWVRCMHIHPRMTGTGMGTRLLETVEEAVIGAGFQRLRAWVPLMAIPLYRSAGFADDQAINLQLPEGTFIGLVMQQRLEAKQRAAA
jgi:GNAT superfamily N-acetyltransferase